MPEAEFLVNSELYKNQSKPSVSRLMDGGFVVVWQSDYLDGFGWGIAAKMYNSNGTVHKDEFIVNTNTEGDQMEPDVMGVGNGNFVVAWTCVNASTGPDICR